MRFFRTSRLLRLPLLFLIVLFLPACSSTPVSVSNQVLTNDQQHVIQVDLLPNPAKILKENKLQITLPPSLQKEMKKNTISIQLSMPGMDHGSVELQSEPNENGIYEVPIIPTMIGDWVCELRMEGQKQIVTATFAFDAVR